MNEELLKRLDTIAEKLGVATNHLNEVFIRQAILEGYYGIFWFVAGIGLAFLTPFLYKKSKTIDDECAAIVMMIFVRIFAIAFIIGGLMDTTSLFNPEYEATKELFKLLK